MYQEFLRGNFTVNKTGNAFSNIAIDQAHEQNNACVKGDGGAIGLMQNPAALRRWMVSGPEIARLIEEFRAAMEKPEKKLDCLHHEQTHSMQVTFFNQVKALSNVIEEMGNPFTDESNDLLVLDSRDLADPAVINAIIISRKLDKISTVHSSLNVLLTKLDQSRTQLNEITFLFSVVHHYEISPEQNTNYHL